MAQGRPVTIATNGFGRPVTVVADSVIAGEPVQFVSAGGEPVVVVASGGYPVKDVGAYTFVNAEAQALVAAMSVQPDNTRKALIDTFWTSFKGHGLASRHAFLAMRAAHDSQAARIDWKTPGGSLATLVNGPLFTTDRGFTGVGFPTSAYLETNRANNLSPATLTDYSFSWFERTNIANNSGAVGAVLGFLTGNGRSGSNTGTARLSSFTDLGAASTDSSGFWTASRNASAVTLYHNGSLFASATLGTDGNLSTATWKELTAADTDFPSARQIAAFMFGQSLDATQAANLYADVMIYLQGVGAA